MRQGRRWIISEIVPDLNALSSLIGQLNKESIHAMYGTSQVGKTTLQLQLLYEVSHKTGKPALLYDTEGGGNQFVLHWDPVFKEKYPDAVVDVRMVRDWRRILRDHGYTIKLKTSGSKAKSDAAKMNTGGKLALTIVDQEDISPILKEVTSKKYCMVLYDSITAPLKWFGSEQQNFPARASATNLWFSEMLNIIDEGDCYVLASHHSSKNPADQWSKENMCGGKAVEFHSKVIMYMKQWAAKGADTYRTIRLVRYFDKKPNEHESLVKLTDRGYIDVTREDMERDKQNAK